jgi:hypothetical protein
MLALFLALFAGHHPEPVVTPESIILTPDFDAVWVPEGVTGPIVAAPFTTQVFEASGE